MSVTPIPASLAPATSSSTSAAGALSGTANEDEFLKLLVAQLQNQDPLDPQKGSDFIAQLAQFSTLEQTTQTNTVLSQIEAGQASLAQQSVMSLVGRNVTAQTTQVQIGATGGPPPLGVHLDGDAAKIQVTISDANGKTVRTITLGAQPAGNVALGWDGKGDNGVLLPPGTYQVAVSATSAPGAAVSSYAELTGAVSSVEFSGGTTKLHIGTAVVKPGDIVSVGQ
jgi:flagellar basal-body rod modification protein FlgD